MFILIVIVVFDNSVLSYKVLFFFFVLVLKVFVKVLVFIKGKEFEVESVGLFGNVLGFVNYIIDDEDEDENENQMLSVFKFDNGVVEKG